MTTAAKSAWRPMCEADLDGVVTVARAGFPDHFEDRACFAERLALYPWGCFVLAARDHIRGYLIAYPWPVGAVPPLNSTLGDLPPERAAFYLHDLALHPEARGQGHARPIVERLADELRAGGADLIALVSVNGTQGFWEGMRFSAVAADAALIRKLASYGPDARYMTRAL